MSLQLFKNDVLFYQRILSCAGHYSGPLNGKWTSAVDTASTAFDAETAGLKVKYGAADPRSEGYIITLLPAAQILARRFMRATVGFAYTVRIISGTRSYAEQDALYAIGRTVELKRKPVTKAQGGESNHNFSIAWDVGIFSSKGAYFTGANKTEQKAYSDLAALIATEVPELEWGGSWPNFPDPPHYQVKTKKSTSAVRALFEAGKAYI